MADSDREVVKILTSIESQLKDIKYDLKDIKREMPKIPYYGDLLKDIEKAVKDLNR